MSTKSEFVTTMEAQLKKWDADVDALAAKGEKVSADARAAYYARIKDLRASREVAQKTFQEILAASESARAQLQAWNGSDLGSDAKSSRENVVGPRQVSAEARGHRMAREGSTVAAIGLIVRQGALAADPVFKARIFHGALPYKGASKSALYCFGSRLLCVPALAARRLPRLGEIASAQAWKSDPESFAGGPARAGPRPFIPATGTRVHAAWERAVRVRRRAQSRLFSDGLHRVAAVRDGEWFVGGNRGGRQRGTGRSGVVHGRREHA